jgi:SAM-dependent MidA family methyltransferase
LRIEESIADVIRERGPMTVAAFMELALYHSQFGYYARAVQRSGRAGDFFTSVDVGPLFGELLERQLAEMAESLDAATAHRDQFPIDVVEAGAGNGRLAADILRAARRRDRSFYDRIRLHLVEVSDEARRAQPGVLGDVRERLTSSSASLPESFEGVLLANELLDALPVHQVVMREDGLHEVYVGEVAPASRSRAAKGAAPQLGLMEGPLSTAALFDYLSRLGIRLQPGWRVEINLRALEWIAEVAARLRRGFVILIDYGHEARELYSATHSSGTLTSFCHHAVAGPELESEQPPWLKHPGEQDLTTHVDFTSVRAAAEAAGFVSLGLLDQTYFLLGLLSSKPQVAGNAPGLGDATADAAPGGGDDLHTRLALKTLLMPGGLGSTHKVLILGKGVGNIPALAGCSYRIRIT